MNRSFLYLVGVIALLMGWIFLITNQQDQIFNVASMFSSNPTQTTVKNQVKKAIKPVVEQVSATKTEIKPSPNFPSPQAGAPHQKPKPMDTQVGHIIEKANESLNQEPTVLVNSEKPQQEVSRNISRIEKLVDNTIQRDEGDLNQLNNKEEELEKALMKLQKSRKNIVTRLDKLQKISVILTTQQKARALPKFGKDQKTALKSYIKSVYGYKNVHLEGTNKRLKLSLNADRLLIRDDRPRRVDQETSNQLIDAIESVLESNSIENTVLVRSSSTPKYEVEVVQDYLRRQFGWSPLILPDKSNDSRYPISLKVLARKKSGSNHE